jgi:hypothetical protein
LFKRYSHYKGYLENVYNFQYAFQYFLLRMSIFQKALRKELPANAPTKMAITKPPKNVRQVRFVSVFPEKVPVKRRSFINRKTVIHNPRHVITMMNVNALRMRMAQEWSNPGSDRLPKVVLPYFHNLMKGLSIVQSWVNW